MPKKTVRPVLPEYIEAHWPQVEKIILKNLNRLPEAGKEAAGYALRTRGKRLRPALLLLCGESFGLDLNNLYSLAAAIELVHTASLLHDDIEDGSMLRRGRATAHEVFGPKGALLAGDSMLALAMCICTAEYSPAVCECLSAALLNTVNGQIKELAKTEDMPDYFDSILLKTGSLMGCACETAAILAGKNKKVCLALRELGENLGAAYQIADDWHDFSPSSQTGKDSCRDLQNGNHTLPVRLLFESIPQSMKAEFALRLQDGPLHEKKCDEICNMMQSETISFQVFSQINFFLEKAKAKLDFLPGSKAKEILLHIVEQTSKTP